jgi:hypothetical protein
LRRRWHRCGRSHPRDEKSPVSPEQIIFAPFPSVETVAAITVEIAILKVIPTITSLKIVFVQNQNISEYTSESIHYSIKKFSEKTDIFT